MHGLAGAIDAAVGIGEGIHRAGIAAPLDAAVGEVEGGGGHVEEGIVAALGLGHQHRRGLAALAAGERGIEA